MTTPCVAIHGVGRHEKGHIKARVQETLGKTRLGGSLAVEEFNWDELVEHSSQRPIRDFLWFLEATAENISVSARLGLRDGATALERALGSLQFHLHRISQWVIALAIGGLVVGIVSPLMMSIPSNLSGLPVDYDGVLAWLPGALKLSSIAILLLSGSILALGLLRAVTSLSVRPLSETVRSVLLLYLQPLLVIVSGVLAVKWTSVTKPVWFLGGFVLLVLVLGAYIPSLFSGEPFAYAAELRYLAYLFLAAGALVLLRLRFTKVWFGAFLKVMLDIFRYLGDPHYRLRVHRALDEMLQKLRAAHPTSGRFVVVAHSLGSVIALDSLLSSRFWRSTDDLYLITMGSPIRRMFQRFFPSILFPVSIDQLARRAAGRVRALYWINIFRPFDFIGTALGLSRSEVGVDESTRQWLRIFSSHSDYWSDGGGSDVHETIDRALEGLKPTSASHAVSASPAFLIPSPPKRHALVERLKNARGTAAIAATIAMFLGTLFWVAISLEVRNVDLAETSRRLQGEGTVVRATARQAHSLPLSGALVDVLGVVQSRHSL